jgi:hypothetical protein
VAELLSWEMLMRLAMRLEGDEGLFGVLVVEKGSSGTEEEQCSDGFLGLASRTIRA